MKESNINIRYAQKEDITEIMRIYDCARKFMRSYGNLNQWNNGYPSEELLVSDIAKNQLYVMQTGEKLCGVFAFITGEDPTYGVIKGGSWFSDSEYGTIHRIAGDGTVHGILEQAVHFCEKQIRHLRVDTHEDNLPMQRAVLKNGFTKCGIIFLADGSPRIAYEKGW